MNPYEKYTKTENPYSKYRSKEEATADKDRMFKEVMGSKGWGTGVGPAIEELGGKVTDLTGSPAAGYATNVALNAIPSFLTMTKGLPGPSPTAQAHNARIAEQGKILEKGKDIGLVVSRKALSETPTRCTP
jgi:hypothetical protein